ncbi:hypothetical protein Pth03_43840 [Planotetraspora thailandica]|uniref:Uncharacterized protein n=1 Tax=Planotetraspora thailandica TaxID=487172 RepID=A0A8J3VDU1_9ACTN|nr:hypothetical protein [Planotetraspora thailandica]GII55995.1 hypothetical protein Pth03_43840 [Planotetraspora thailandica]
MNSDRQPDVPTSVLRLAETLVMLAASADEQVAWVDRHQWCVDELALDFDWANGWVPLAVNERSPGLFSPVLHDLLQRIDDRLSEMSGQANADKWTPDGLAADPGWAEVRHLSSQALTEIATLCLIVIPSPADL